MSGKDLKKKLFTELLEEVLIYSRKILHDFEKRFLSVFQLNLNYFPKQFHLILIFQFSVHLDHLFVQ